MIVKAAVESCADESFSGIMQSFVYIQKFIKKITVQALKPTLYLDNFEENRTRLLKRLMFVKTLSIHTDRMHN